MNCGPLLSGLLSAEFPKDAQEAAAPGDASAAATADEYEDVNTHSAIAIVPDTANCTSISRTNVGSQFHARGNPDGLGGQIEDRLAAFSTITIKLKEKEEENSAFPTCGELHGSWGPEEARMLHCLPAKESGGDATIESLEILAYNDFLAVSSRMRLHEKEQEDPQKHHARPAARASTGRKQENPLKHRARLAARASTRTGVLHSSDSSENLLPWKPGAGKLEKPDVIISITGGAGGQERLAAKHAHAQGNARSLLPNEDAAPVESRYSFRLWARGPAVELSEKPPALILTV